MTREITETCLGKRIAHDIRAAAIRLARERAEEDADPSLAYGCVDWFRYDVSSPSPEADRASQPVVARRDGARGDALSGH